VSPTGKTVALVVRGPAWREDAILREQDEIGGHLALMVRLSREGVIEAAGPFATADERLNARLVGLVVFADGTWIRPSVCSPRTPPGPPGRSTTKW
jgi:hypothetical protein